MSDSALRIAHLYPEELGINGDRGNVLVLATRLRWRGLGCEVVDVAVGDALPSEIDLVHIGSGPRSARDAVIPDARRHAARLREWVGTGMPVLAIGAGLHALGTSILALDGTRHEGLGVLPVEVVDLEVRTVGEVLGERSAPGRFAGFLNHAAGLTLGDATPLTMLQRGSTGPEGVRTGSLVGTHLHGPVLPMNPWLADDVLIASLARHGQSLPEAEERTREADERARRARGAIARRLGGASDDV